MVWYSHLFQNFPQFIVTHIVKGFGIVNKVQNAIKYIMQNARLGETEAGIKILGRTFNNFRYADDTTLGKKRRRTKEPRDESERGERKNWLKIQHSKNKDHSIQSHHFMASGPITSWQIDGETVETDFIFLAPKITADGNCSYEIKRCLLLGRKVMTNLDSILKSRDITLPTKVQLVKAMVFPVVMYGCES